MADVITLHRCVCGEPGKLREIVLSPGERATFFACDKCFDASFAFLGRMRPVFDAMRAVGVPSDIANEAMTYLLDRIPDDSMLEDPVCNAR